MISSFFSCEQPPMPSGKSLNFGHLIILRSLSPFTCPSASGKDSRQEHYWKYSCSSAAHSYTVGVNFTMSLHLMKRIALSWVSYLNEEANHLNLVNYSNCRRARFFNLTTERMSSGELYILTKYNSLTDWQCSMPSGWFLTI